NEVLAGGLAAMILAGVLTGGAGGRVVTSIQSDETGKPQSFVFTFGNEVVKLYPGLSWAGVDRHKWTARGLIEEPNHFHVHVDGSVEINWERIRLTDEDGPRKLQHQIEKRHAHSVTHDQQQATATAGWTAPSKPEDDRVHFRVKLDRFGHLIIECSQGGEREETGLRGIAALIHNGKMLKPATMHVDAMQRAIEIDGIRFECTEDGAKQLEAVLNAKYVPTGGAHKGMAIHIKESAVSSTGFDIHFMTKHAGVPFEVKGHLTQETLDILSDSARCDLLQPGVQMRIAAPYLLVRRRRADMGEDKIPGVPDVNYLRTTAMELEQILNHPMVRKGGAVVDTAMSGGETRTHQSPQIQQIRVVRNAANEKLCWFECVMNDGSVQPPKAITHHNIAELQQFGVFRPNLEVSVTLDNRSLVIFDRETRQERTAKLDPDGTDDELFEVRKMLTLALKPVAARAGAVVRDGVAKAGPIKIEIPSKSQPSHVETVLQPPVPQPPPPVAAPRKPEIDPVISALFQEADPLRVNLAVFDKLRTRFGLPVQDVLFSLPMVFNDRRFEIINLEGGEVSDLMELRDEWFYGFYLSHVSERKVLLVYACNGTHIEWGPDKCVVQQSVKSEPEEFRAPGLLG
ncbi:MAG TPA: hypothetical protein PKA41_19365, partial [Verrucomicrobiota bacterium]|nr:hypothetical protein [Verrucomicrobiota bacterium]